MSTPDLNTIRETLAALTAAAEKATPRPWRVEPHDGLEGAHVLSGEDGGEVTVASLCSSGGDTFDGQYDARLVAAAVNAVPGLVAALVAALEECAAVRSGGADGAGVMVAERVESVIAGAVTSQSSCPL